MIEIERKFLVTSDAFKEASSKSIRIKQGYLSIDPLRTVRVRIKGDTGYLTIKGKSSTSGMSRVEVEEEISIEKANVLLSLCLPGSIDKTRYEVTIGAHLWEVDEFYDANEGLLLAEVELTSEDEQVTLPSWVGREVTGDMRYYNSQLLKKPFKDWT